MISIDIETLSFLNAISTDKKKNETFCWIIFKFKLNTGKPVVTNKITLL